MRPVFVFLFILLFGTICSTQTLPPQPLKPVPSHRQLLWHEMEYYAFVHFGMNTFTDKEWGYGDESPEIFSPTEFDAEKIVSVFKNAGMSGMILTAKHHDGFCLWQTKYAEHSVKQSKWKNGTGDIVREFADACKKDGLKFGMYLSPWDRNNKDYGTPQYITTYRNQLRELLTNYGNIFEVWHDGANGGDGFYGGARETRTIDRRTYYDWDSTWSLVRQLQPNAVIFSDVGPDIRWVGNENGYAGETCWAMYSPVGEQGDTPAPGYTRYKEGITGHREGTSWLPAECDVSVRPGWFYHASDDSLVKSPEELFRLYFQSVGRNGSLLLNVPPDRRGQINANDVKSLNGLKQLLDATFENNFADGAILSASNVRGNDERFSASNMIDNNSQTYWATDDSLTSATIELTLREPTRFNCIMLQEFISLGQRVEEFAVYYWNENRWEKLTEGTTIGHKRLLTFPEVITGNIRLTILKAKGCPVLSNFGLFQTAVHLEKQ
jgi:alpha-L-fucosidase